MNVNNRKYGDINRNTSWKYCTNNNNNNNLSTVNNNTLLSASEQSEIIQFYNEGKVLITGSTGFIGKALTEKLLRTCVTVSTIYLLIRPKKGQSCEERCNDLLQNPVSMLLLCIHCQKDNFRRTNDYSCYCFFFV